MIVPEFIANWKKTALLGIWLAVMATGCTAFRGRDAQSKCVGPIFKNWQECFRFMAGGDQCLLVNKLDNDFLFKLAAESSAELYWFSDKQDTVVVVIKLDALDGHGGPYSAIRGAQGNGPYYIFLPVEEGFQFLGEMGGNCCSWADRNHYARFITEWHMSTNQSGETIYDWDGSMFKETSHILYEYDQDGNRHAVKE